MSDKKTQAAAVTRSASYLFQVNNPILSCFDMACGPRADAQSAPNASVLEERPAQLNKQSRRRVLENAAALAFGAVVVGTVGAFGRASAAATKHSQKSVDYQDHPKGGHSCNTCNAFQPPNRCKTVEGYVEARGWCNLYKHS